MPAAIHGKKKAASLPGPKAGNRQKKVVVTRKPKRTSIGLRHPPLNKHKRRGWKAYRGQGRPR